MWAASSAVAVIPHRWTNVLFDLNVALRWSSKTRYIILKKRNKKIRTLILCLVLMDILKHASVI